MAVILIVIIFYVLQNNQDGSTNTLEFISGTKDVFQILFFIVLMTITILSYLQAKKTLFTPIKTETFKIQIKSFEEILAFFQNKTETDLTELFDLNNIVMLNGSLLFHKYIETFFKGEVEINKQKITELQDLAKGAIVKDYAMQNFITPDLYQDKNSDKKEEFDIKNPALILSKWQEDKIGMVHLTEKFLDSTRKLNNLIASPLIPKKLKNELEEFEELVSENIDKIISFMEEISITLPKKFPTKESLNNFDFTGLWNNYNKIKKPLETKSKEIMNFITNYLKIEEITK